MPRRLPSVSGPARARAETSPGGYRSAQLGIFYNGLSSSLIGGDFFYSTIRVAGGTIPDLDAVQFRLVTHIDF